MQGSSFAAINRGQHSLAEDREIYRGSVSVSTFSMHSFNVMSCNVLSPLPLAPPLHLLFISFRFERRKPAGNGLKRSRALRETHRGRTSRNEATSGDQGFPRYGKPRQAVCCVLVTPSTAELYCMRAVLSLVCDSMKCSPLWLRSVRVLYAGLMSRKLSNAVASHFVVLAIPPVSTCFLQHFDRVALQVSFPMIF